MRRPRRKAYLEGKRRRGRRLEPIERIMPTVKLYANLRRLAGTKELSITGTTVGAVVSELARQHPLVGEFLLENSGLRQHAIVTLNGYNITDLGTPVTEQDSIAIFPPLAGG